METNKDLRPLIEEAIKLELGMARLYLLCHHVFPEDAGFWWKIAIEEEHHAALLRSGEQYFLDAGEFPVELVGSSLAALANFNGEIESIFRQGSDALPSREFVFNLALKLEESAGEVHFQNAMHETDHPSEAIKLFQSLNEGDKDHAERIRKYMRQNGIDVTCP